MKLKCIGGKADGMSVEVSDVKYRQGDNVNVPNYPTSVELKFEPTPTIDVNYYIYIIDVIKYRDKADITEIWFLRPTNFTAADALRFQFLK